MVRARLWLAIGLMIPLALGACGRSTPVASVDQAPACASPGVAARLKQVLLAPPAHRTRTYAERVRGAQVDLTDTQAGGFDAAARVSACSATARLTSPFVDPADAVTSQPITYDVAAQADGSVKVSNVQTSGGDLKQFALLLQKGRAPPAAPAAPPKPAAAMIVPVDTSLPDKGPGPLRGPAPLLSDDTQSLVDQAGDSRAVLDNQTDAASPTP